MRKFVLWTTGVWWLAHILLIAGHVLHVMIYAMAVAPGQEHADYEAYANASGPWFSIIFGGPVFYWLGRNRKEARRFEHLIHTAKVSENFLVSLLRRNRFWPIRARRIDSPKCNYSSVINRQR